MTDPAEEEFRRRVSDPDLIEARGCRRARRRKMRKGLTDDELGAEEDEAFARTKLFVEMQELVGRLPPGKRRKKKPIGRPAGSELTDADLIEVARWMTEQYDAKHRRRSDEWAAERLSTSASSVQRARSGRPWTYFLRFSARDDDQPHP